MRDRAPAHPPDHRRRPAADALARIGLTVNDLKGLKPEDQFQRIADGLNAVEGPTVRAATAMELFGKSGTQLLPMLSTLREVRAEAQARGLVPTDQAVKDAIRAYFDPLRINDDVIAAAVKARVLGVAGVYDTTDFDIGTSGPPSGEANIAISITQIATIDDANITINANAVDPS